MMLTETLRHALPSLPSRHSRQGATYPQKFNRVMHFDIVRNKRHHTKQLLQILRADTAQVLYTVHKTPGGVKLVSTATNATLFRATINKTFKTVRIHAAHDDSALFTTRQHGSLFSITDVFHGEMNEESAPDIQLCAGSDYTLTEVNGGRTLAVVERELRWTQFTHHSVYVDVGLNAPLYLLLVVTINLLTDV